MKKGVLTKQRVGIENQTQIIVFLLSTFFIMPQENHVQFLLTCMRRDITNIKKRTKNICLKRGVNYSDKLIKCNLVYFSFYLVKCPLIEMSTIFLCILFKHSTLVLHFY